MGKNVVYWSHIDIDCWTANVKIRRRRMNDVPESLIFDKFTMLFVWFILFSFSLAVCISKYNIHCIEVANVQRTENKESEQMYSIFIDFLLSFFLSVYLLFDVAVGCGNSWHSHHSTGTLCNQHNNEKSLKYLK